jgi:hypothetical protein
MFPGTLSATVMGVMSLTASARLSDGDRAAIAAVEQRLAALPGERAMPDPHHWRSAWPGCACRASASR